jgi:Co/Zn/Cd efflux system component
MPASRRRTFSINDMLSNLGILAAGVLVLLLGRAWPDLVIGMAIAFVAAKGGWEILEDARRMATSSARTAFMT